MASFGTTLELQACPLPILICHLSLLNSDQLLGLSQGFRCLYKLQNPSMRSSGLPASASVTSCTHPLPSTPCHLHTLPTPLSCRLLFSAYGVLTPGRLFLHPELFSTPGPFFTPLRLPVVSVLFPPCQTNLPLPLLP